MGVLRQLVPFVRPLFLAGVVTALIMIGLPTFLAFAATAAVR